MPYVKEHILVFLAYISDVEAEANVAKEIEKSINRGHEQLGIVLDLRTWKDVPAEFGNPQEKINRTFVENCDVFIGLIWKKWGMPTGQSDCGFKEEFDIAERRYNATGKPTILLYAKTVNEQDIKGDEKEGFNKIKEFKDEIINKQKGFLIPFKTTDEWKEIIRERLTQYVINKHISTSKTIVEPQSSQVISSVEKSEIIEKVKTPKEIQSLIDDLVAHKSNIEKISNIENFKKIRLFLLSSALFYDTTLYEILGNHEIHLLYLHRENIKPTGLEAKLIFRSIISDRSNLKTGWFWLKNMEDKILRGYTINHLINDANKEVRYGAINFMNKFWLKRYKNQLLNAISDNEDEIKIKALDICAARGDESYLKTIETHLSNANKDVAQSAWIAKFAILSRTKIEAAIKFLQESENNRGFYWYYLEKIKDNISEVKLRELISYSDSTVQVFAYKQLLLRGLFSIDDIRSLLNNQSAELRALAFLSLIDRGEKFDAVRVYENWPSEPKGLLGGWYSNKQRDSIVEKIYESYEKEKLAEDIKYLSDTGHLAYFSYGVRFFDLLKDQLYKDLDENFKRLIDTYVEQLERLLGIEKQKIKGTYEHKNLEKQMENSIQFLKTTEFDDSLVRPFILAALKILGLKGTSDSLRYARKYANSNDKEIQGLVISIIAKYGGAEDVPALIKIAFDNYGSNRIEAVRYALKFSGFDKTVIKQFLESGEKEIIKICLAYDLVVKLYALTEDAKKLLMDKTDDIRLYALCYLANVLTKKELTKLLINYLAGTTYYYNVICWLDRILFASPKIRRIFKQELLNMINYES